MPKYFFHVLNGNAALDVEGTELSSLDHMREEAIISAGQMLITGNERWKGREWQMVVVDEAGAIVFGVNVSVDRHGL